jgi:acyl-CoA synthetase (AMP-forming)/AMP-acid ligase II
VCSSSPLVRDVAAVGAPDDEWGERIVAVVVPVDDTLLTPDEVRTVVRERLRGSRTPDDVVITQQLPYSPAGKLLRRELVSELSAGAADGPAPAEGPAKDRCSAVDIPEDLT